MFPPPTLAFHYFRPCCNIQVAQMGGQPEQGPREQVRQIDQHECLPSLSPTCRYCRGPDNNVVLLLQAVPFGPGVVRPSPISASLPSNAPTEQVCTTTKVCTFNTSHQTGDPGAHDGQRSAPATRKHFGKPDAESSSPTQETGPAEILCSTATPGII